MRDFLTLISEEYVVLDGGMGTQLQQKGLTPQEIPEEWNLSHPGEVEQIHLDFLTAGAQIIETNTFGGSPLKLSMTGKQHLSQKVNKKGVELALSARKKFTQDPEASEEERNKGKFVAGSAGPSGRMMGMEVSPQEVQSSYASQGEVLSSSGVDLFIVETMMSLEEAVVATKTLKNNFGLPVITSMVFNKTKKGEFRTLFGNTVSESVSSLIDAGADAVGVNCGLVQDYIQVITEMRKITSAPLVLYPNAGVPRKKGESTVFEQTPEEMISYLYSSIEAGATILGGCCGTTPEYIRLLSQRIKGRKR
ncbi:MAG: homocysteine S-methyltransferase family protein [Spirochaetota bacterium]